MTLQPPERTLPDKNWEHFEVWERVNDLIYALPNYFETELVIRGINVTEIFSIGSVFANIIESQVIKILNQLRSVWDPNNEYSDYQFVRQSQTFPDVLFRQVTNPNNIIFGIELKSWYVLSKEGEPSFRYKIDPDACATADLLVLIPWLLSDVVSGTPKLLVPYKELAKYAAEYRNYYWVRSRTRRNLDATLQRPPEKFRHPYPKSKEEASDEAVNDKGSNFGRIARAGILDEFVAQIKNESYLGVKIQHWIKFFKAISETNTDDAINAAIERLRKKVESSSRDNEVRRQKFLAIVEQIESLWEDFEK